jgi:hypothetical protein
MYPKLQMLLKWDKAPEQAQEWILAFVGAAEGAKDRGPNEVMAAMLKLMDDIVASERAKRAETARAIRVYSAICCSNPLKHIAIDTFWEQLIL